MHMVRDPFIRMANYIGDSRLTAYMPHRTARRQHCQRQRSNLGTTKCQPLLPRLTVIASVSDAISRRRGATRWLSARSLVIPEKARIHGFLFRYLFASLAIAGRLAAYRRRQATIPPSADR